MKKEETKQKCEHCKQFISKYGCACGGQIKEPTQRFEKYSERFDNKDNELIEGIFNPNTWGKRLVNDEPKQETLEEAGVAYSKKVSQNHTSHMLGFVNGAKWQQQQNKNLYSEEEVLDILSIRLKYFGIQPNEVIDRKWFEQFKNKQ